MQITLPVVWQVSDTVTVEADSIEEAIGVFKKIADDIPLPSDPDYVDGSFSLWTEDKETIELFNRDRTFTKDV